jgi:hypothetical protein
MLTCASYAETSDSCEIRNNILSNDDNNNKNKQQIQNTYSIRYESKAS